MSHRFWSLAAIAVISFLAIPEASAQPASPQGFVRGRILVRFQQGVSQAQINGALAAQAARSLGQIGQSGVHIVELPAGANEQAVANAFGARADVVFAELDRIVPPSDLIPNDPWFASWEWHLQKILAPAAWSTTTGATGMIIAVIDTGVDGTHPDLASKMVAGWNIYGNNSDARDVVGHGTQVAGAAAAASNNGVGVASVCWGCWIMPVRVSDATGSATYSNLASGLTWAADHGARVANISYMVTTSGTVTSAANYFQNRGGVVVSSAGNYSTFDSSADNPSIVTVSASDSNDVLYTWSNTGNNIDVAAPGCAYTTSLGGGYASGCGTSFSAPIVAGVAALILSANPGMSPASVISRLRSSADDVGPAGWDPSFGSGRVNAAAAVAGTSDSTPPSITILAPSDGSIVSGTVSIQNSASDNVGVASVSCYLDNALLATLTTAPFNCSWNTTTAANGTHGLSSIARDAAGNSSSASRSVSVSNTTPGADTIAPVISILSPSAGSSVSGNVSVGVQASDNVRVVRVQLYVDGVLTSTATAAPWTTKWNTNGKVARGAHILQVRAFDAANNVGSSAVITVYK